MVFNILCYMFGPFVHHQVYKITKNNIRNVNYNSSFFYFLLFSSVYMFRSGMYKPEFS
jgi:hypothetical protein